MSVSLLDCIECAGFDLSKREDALWLLSKVSEFENLIIAAEDLLEEL